MIRPGNLPRVRDQVSRHLTPGHSLYDNLAGNDPGWSEMVRSSLRIAELYWASAEMSALAVGAAQGLTETWWGPEDRPSPCGMLVFDGGVGTTIDMQGVVMHVDAVSWGPGATGCAVVCWTDRSRVAAMLAAQGQELIVEEVPPLVPIGTFRMPIDRPVPASEMAPEDATSIGALAAAWLLMTQPTVVDRTRQHAAPDVRRSYARAGRGEPEITYVTLRRAYVPDLGGEDGQADGRHYRHRWITRGHWRQQPVGPGREQRRLTWIPEHIKGPEGAPMLATTKVNVWRR